MEKQRTPPASTLSAAEVDTTAGLGSTEVHEVDEQCFSKRPGRPQGSKAAKQDLLLREVKEVVIRAQAKATANLAAANMAKVQVLQDQAALSLFTMPHEDRLTEQAQEYITLRREEEMAKLRWRVAEEKCDEARAATEAERLQHERMSEV